MSKYAKLAKLFAQLAEDEASGDLGRWERSTPIGWRMVEGGPNPASMVARPQEYRRKPKTITVNDVEVPKSPNGIIHTSTAIYPAMQGFLFITATRKDGSVWLLQTGGEDGSWQCINNPAPIEESAQTDIDAQLLPRRVKGDD